jgi:hypothetical protein
VFDAVLRSHAERVMDTIKWKDVAASVVSERADVADSGVVRNPTHMDPPI